MNSAATIYRQTINHFFPVECLACGTEGKWLCSDCAAMLKLIKAPTCPFCNRLSPGGRTCSRCRNKHQLTGARSIWHYEEPIPTVIHKLKYAGLTACLEWLEPPLGELTRHLPIANQATAVFTSVPITPSRQRSRGFNQSELLAKIASRAVDKSYQATLRRTSDTRSQTKLTRRQRFDNMRQQFAPLPKVNLNGKIVVIVDDVITTGSTLANCAAVLKEAGARQVWAITIAKD